MDMARRRIDLRLDEDFLALVDAEAERLGQTRTKFVERALESALGMSEAEADRVPAPSRASEAEAPTTFVEAAKRATLPPGVKTAREVLSDGVAAVDRAAAFRRASQRGKS